MVFSSQVWAGCKQASAEEADLKKWSCSYLQSQQTAQSPKKSGISSYRLGLDGSSTVILQQTEKISVQAFTRPPPRTTHPLSHPSW